MNPKYKYVRELIEKMRVAVPWKISVGMSTSAMLDASYLRVSSLNSVLDHRPGNDELVSC